MPDPFYPATKVCTNCGNEKPLGAFHWKNRASKRRHARCKECQAVYYKIHYNLNADQYVERAKRRNEGLRETKRELVARLRNQPCCDCGKTFPPWCMQFDHRQGRAIKGRYSPQTIWNMAGSREVSLDALLTEIQKCDVVCANCHCERTWKRGENPMWKIG